MVSYRLHSVPSITLLINLRPFALLLVSLQQFMARQRNFSAIQSVVTDLHELVQLYCAPLLIQPAQQLSPSLLSAALQRVVPVATHSSPAAPSNPSNLPNISFPATSASASDPTQPAPLQLALHSANSATLNLDVTGKPLTYATAIHGPDRHHWIAAEAEDFDRLFETKTLTSFRQKKRHHLLQPASKDEAW